MSTASLLMCLLAFGQPPELAVTANTLEVAVVGVCGARLPGVSVVLYHNVMKDGGLDLATWRREGLPKKTDGEGRVQLRASVAGEFVALAGLEGFTPAFSAPFVLSPDSPADSLHSTEIVLASPDSLRFAVDPIRDETDLRNGLLSLQCHYESFSRSWEGLQMSGQGFVAVKKTAFCSEIDDFVHLSWSNTESGPEPVRTELRADGGRREYYQFPGCPTPLPAIELMVDLKEALGCERLEVPCRGHWD